MIRDLPDGAKIVHEFQSNEPIVSMLEFKGRLLVATTLGVYELKNNKLETLEIVADPQGV